MSALLERSGFPVLPMPSLKLEMQLFPVLKVQFEVFLAEVNQFDDAWYEAVLSMNPRIAISRLSPENVGRLFLTGIQFREIRPYANWLGPEWRVPSVSEWRLIYRLLAHEPLSRSYMERLAASGPAAQARSAIKNVFEVTGPKSMLELAFMAGGVVEWVNDGGRNCGLGVPSGNFASVLADPINSPPILPIDESERIPYFGFRLVRPLVESRGDDATGSLAGLFAD